MVGGLIALRQGNRQRMLDLGSLYLQRYWAIDDDLLRLDKGRQNTTRLIIDTNDCARTSLRRRNAAGLTEASGESGTRGLRHPGLPSCLPKT